MCFWLLIEQMWWIRSGGKRKNLTGGSERLIIKQRKATEPGCRQKRRNRMFVQMRAAYAFSSAVQPAAVKRPESYDGFSAGKSAAEKTADLQSRRQQLQNDLLLTQAAGTDSAGAVADRQKQLEAELKEVSAELRAVKTPCVAPAEKDEAPRADEKPVQLAIRRRVDIYEPGGSRSAESFGVYQIKKGREGYSILFQPYEGE